MLKHAPRLSDMCPNWSLVWNKAKFCQKLLENRAEPWKCATKLANLVTLPGCEVVDPIEWDFWALDIKTCNNIDAIGTSPTGLTSCIHTKYRERPRRGRSVIKLCKPSRWF
jgi:hypothetical protein